MVRGNFELSIWFHGCLALEENILLQSLKICMKEHGYVELKY